MKDKTILLNWILAISLSIILFSCHKEPTKFQWQPAILFENVKLGGIKEVEKFLLTRGAKNKFLKKRISTDTLRKLLKNQYKRID